METLRQMQEPEPLADGSGFPVMLGPFAVGVSGDEGPQTVKPDGPVGERVPTAGLTNGSVNRSAVYTQLYLGLLSAPAEGVADTSPKKVHTVVAETSRLATKT